MLDANSWNAPARFKMEVGSCAPQTIYTAAALRFAWLDVAFGTKSMPVTVTVLRCPDEEPWQA